MNICSLNFGSVNFNKINFVHQNPINFKGNQKEDEFNLSTEARAKRLISTLKKENEELLAKQDQLIQQIQENINNEVRTDDIPRQYYSLSNELRKTKHKIQPNAQMISNLESSPNFLIMYEGKTWKYASQAEKLRLAAQYNIVLDLNAPEYSHIQPKAKRALHHALEQHKLQNGTIIFNNEANKEYLSQFDDYNIIEEDELSEDFGINAEELFSGCMELRLGLKRVILIPRSELTDKIFEDIASKKVATQQGLKIPELILPWTYEKYSQDDELSIFNYKFIKLDDENNQKLMDSSHFRSLVQTLPFNYNEIGLIDINDEHNRKLLESAHRLYPTKSQYAFDGLCNDGNNKVFNIPTAELERLGFSKSKLLIDLIKNGKLDGIQDENGEYCVTIDTTNRLGKNKNLDVLYLLRKQDPKIKTFKEIATALSIPQKRLEYAIFSGEVDIIDEYINIADREIRYINIATPKNQEFIRKVKFEQELEKQIKENQREARRQARIEHKDLTSRKQGVRMALVWEFMPNTKAIGSMLAKKDGYVAKLLAKEDDPNETLTNLEEAKINSYRKEMWTLAGTDELKEAYKKAGKIMKAFSENGLSAVDEEYLPIFERYGFTN